MSINKEQIEKGKQFTNDLNIVDGQFNPGLGTTVTAGQNGASLWRTRGGVIYKNTLDSERFLKYSEKILARQESFTERSFNCDMRTSRNVTDNILNFRELISLKLLIEKHIYNYMYETNKVFMGFVDSSWVNVYEKNCYQEFHNHVDDCEKCISGVLYLTSDASPIEFNIENRDIFSPQLGDIILFNDEILHRVFPNRSDSMRMSLAFNYKKVALWAKK